MKRFMRKMRNRGSLIFMLLMALMLGNNVQVLASTVGAHVGSTVTDGYLRLQDSNTDSPSQPPATDASASASPSKSPVSTPKPVTYYNIKYMTGMASVTGAAVSVISGVATVTGHHVISGVTVGTASEGERGSNPLSATEQTYVTLSTPKMNGYFFDGWYLKENFSESSRIRDSKLYMDSDKVVYGRWIENRIDYDLQGGTNDPANPSRYNVGTGVSELKAAARNGYDFSGWFAEPDHKNQVTGVSSASSGPMTLYAKWTPKVYNITYELDGGTNSPQNPDSYTYGQPVTGLSDPVKKDHMFEGWYTDSEFTKEFECIGESDTGDITLYALFTPVEHEDDIEGATFGPLFARATDLKARSITLVWAAVDGADGYMVYASPCNTGGKVYKYKYKATTKKTKWKDKNLKKDKYYKYYIVAFKNKDGKKKTLCTSVTIHATTSSSKYGVAESISLNKNKVGLKAGKTFKLIAKELNKTKIIRSHRPICYESSDSSIASVNKNGMIKAKKKGTCRIYVFAQNGIYKEVTVKVK